MDALGIPLKRKVKHLSGGQQAQISLTMALAKRAPLLVLDEPVSSLDPVARLEFMRDVMATAADTGLTVLIASHVVSELERFCDWLVVLTGGRMQIAGPVDDLIAEHRLLTVPARDPRRGASRAAESTVPTATGTPPRWSAPTQPGWRHSCAPAGRPTRWASNSSSWPTCSAARRRRRRTIRSCRGAARARPRRR